MTEHHYDTTVIIIGISVIVSALISILLYSQLRNTQKQTKNLDIEIRNRVRPWIKIDPMLITYGMSKDHTKAWKDCKPADNIITVKFTGALKNIGSSPSKDIIIKTVLDSSPIDKDNFHEFTQDNFKTTLLPGEDYPLSVSISTERFNELDKIPLYYGIHVKYSYDDKNYESIGKIFELHHDGTTLSEYWNDDPPNIKYD